MARVTKATPEQREEYVTRHITEYGSKPVHPLYGFVTVEGHVCAVEFPNEGPDNPKYEVMAPKGYHFAEGLHSLLCFSMADLQDRICEGLHSCTPACDGNEEVA